MWASCAKGNKDKQDISNKQWRVTAVTLQLLAANCVLEMYHSLLEMPAGASQLLHSTACAEQLDVTAEIMT